MHDFVLQKTKSLITQILSESLNCAWFLVMPDFGLVFFFSYYQCHTSNITTVNKNHFYHNDEVKVYDSKPSPARQQTNSVNISPLMGL